MARQRQPAFDWHAATNPDALLAALRGAYSVEVPEPLHVVRRLQLFDCACARMVWDILPTDARNAVYIRERFADGRATEDDVRASAVRPAMNNPITSQQHALNAISWAAAQSAATALACRAAGPAPPGGPRQQKWHSVWKATFEAARAHQAELVRDIFPPPGYTPLLRDEWRTSTVAALARHMDESGDFSAVPILADALQDAGCDDDAMLARCRTPSGVHCRGNWVVDLALGRD